MSIKINKIFRNIGIIAMAFAMFFSTASSCTVFAAYSSPSTVSVSKPGFGMVDLTSGNLHVRQYASTSASVVAKIPANKYFAHFYDVADWYCGLYGNVVGSVSGDYVTKYAF